MCKSNLIRRAEPELMDLQDEVEVYAKADFAAVNDAFVSRLLELAGAREQAVSADLGCGPCDIPIRVAGARPHWRITAVDASAPMLETARQAVASAGLAQAISLVLADAKGSDLPSAAFDIVFSNSLLHHVSSPARFWDEVRRIAKAGGLVFVRDLFRPEDEEQARRLVAQHAGSEPALLQEEFYRSLLSAYTLDEIQTQLKEAGLAGLSVAQVSDRHMDIFGSIPL